MTILLRRAVRLAPVLAALGACLAAPAGPPEVVTVTARRLLDVEAGRIVENVVVRIEGGDITAVEPRKPGESVTYDLGDVTLVPGLIDCHTHLVGREEQTPDEELRESTAHAALEGAVNARKTLEAGFTTVRDLGSRDFADVALRDVIASGKLAGPRMLVAVKSLSATGGHGDRNEIPFDLEVHRYSAVADGPEEVRRKVRENVKYGADWIKVLATGGVMSKGTDPRSADYSEDELRAAVVAAREKGRDVAAHAHGAEGIRRAARAGVRSVEHASMLDDAAVAAVKENGTFLVPNPYTSSQILSRGKAGGFTDYQIEKSRTVYTLKMESLKRAIREGLPIAYGTDSGVQVHGENGKQLAIFVEAGMTPLQAIRTATTVAARLLRMETRIGRIAKGYAADLIAVAGNPLEKVAALEKPVFVMKDGKAVLLRATR